MDTTSTVLYRQYDAAQLTADLANATRHFASAPQIGKYHDGSWTGISLRNALGDYQDTLASHTGHSIDTPVLAHCPYFKQILDTLGCPVYVARLLFLPPGKIIGEHSDPGFGWRNGMVRLHIPIVTDPRVEFKLGSRDMYWKTGEFWFGDFSLNHSLCNRSDITRVHLVLDCPVTPATLTLFPSEFLRQVRTKTEILQLDAIHFSDEILQQYCGKLRIMAPVLGVYLPLSGAVSVAHNMLCVKLRGLPARYHFAPTAEHRFQCNQFELRWADTPQPAILQQVICTNLRTGKIQTLTVSTGESIGTRLFAILQTGLVGGLWYGYFGMLKWKRWLGKSRYSVNAAPH